MNDDEKFVVPSKKSFRQWDGYKGYAVQHRTAYVPVEPLREIFEWLEPARKEEEGILAFKVRGLTGAELARRDKFMTKEYNNIIEGIEEGLIQSDRFKFAGAIRTALGAQTNTDNDLDPALLEARKFVLLVGLVDPKLSKGNIFEIMVHFPAVFTALTNKILELTGFGSEVKKKP
jgi:hypothetical protein